MINVGLCLSMFGMSFTFIGNSITFSLKSCSWPLKCWTRFGLLLGVQDRANENSSKQKDKKKIKKKNNENNRFMKRRSTVTWSVSFTPRSSHDLAYMNVWLNVERLKYTLKARFIIILYIPCWSFVLQSFEKCNVTRSMQRCVHRKTKVWFQHLTKKQMIFIE